MALRCIRSLTKLTRSGHLGSYSCVRTNKTSSTMGEVTKEQCMEEYKHSFVPTLLSNRVAFITGGGSGIGFRIAEIFMRHGCDTVIASRNLTRVQQAADTLAKCTGRKCLPLAMDVRNPEQVQKAMDKAVSEMGRLDIVINNAAGNFYSPLAGMSYNAFKTVIEIDTIGTFNTSKAAFDAYLRDHGGVILNISAALGYRGDALVAHAGSAKAAIDTLTKHMAVEWGQYGVRSLAISPGLVTETEGYNRLGAPLKHVLDVAMKKVPLGRWLNRKEVAETVLFLVSDLGSHITGTTVVCDCGHWLTANNDIQSAMDMMMGVGSKL